VLLCQVQRDAVLLASERQAAADVPPARRVREERRRRDAAPGSVAAPLRQRRRPAVDRRPARRGWTDSDAVSKYDRLAGRLYSFYSERRSRPALNQFSPSSLWRCLELQTAAQGNRTVGARYVTR